MRRQLPPSSSSAGRNSATDRSPFPKSWSINYNNVSDDHLPLSNKESEATDESSVFSTASQEQRSRRDRHGYCKKHPHIQLARKVQASFNRHQLRSRFSKVFSSRHHNDSSTVTDDNRPAEREEWKVVRATCPECEKEVEQSKLRYHSKNSNATETIGGALTSYVPFPATLTLTDSHSRLAEGTLAFRIRTDPIPTGQTGDGGNGPRWKSPDDAMDFLIPAADFNGEMIMPDNSGAKKQQAKHQHEYQIMERIIPLPSIDHVSRGGDAWDILRQSTGENDFGCRCDVKIHGYSDRLLRFDVVDFDSMTHTEKYNIQNVITLLNSIVAWDRQARKANLANWMSGLTSWLEECLSLGVPKTD